ncbi:MAG: hypothetical protein IR160_03130 [Salinibacterium sp.]|nr:hypothetical protein [Salinibacterium sp.]MBF0671560.1 hypothetical protein [Salinibacterium sp.]
MFDDALGERWWVGYDQATGSYFADPEEDVATDVEMDAVSLPTYADFERYVAPRVEVPMHLRDGLLSEEPRNPAVATAVAGRQLEELRVAVDCGVAADLRK